MTVPTDPRALGRQRLAAMRRRAQRIRLSVTALGVALFIAAFGGISIQLATGHDPALHDTPAVVADAAASTSSSTTTDEQADDDTAADDTTSADDTASDDAGDSSDSATSVTTQQS